MPKKKSNASARQNGVYILVSILVIVIALAVIATHLFVPNPGGTVVQDTITKVQKEQAEKNKKQTTKKKKTSVKTPATNAKAYEYSKPVPAGQAAEDSAFGHTALIGNSRMQGFYELSGISQADLYAQKGISVRDFMEKKNVKTRQGMVTLFSSMAGKDYDKIYIMFGLNELGWVDTSSFSKYYTAAIKNLKEVFPNAQIYIESILPVNEEKVKDNTGEKTNARIRYYNELLQKVAKDEQVYYLNAAEALTDEQGELFSDASVDGVHLNKNYCQKWYAYMKNHIVPPQNKSAQEKGTKETNES